MARRLSERQKAVVFVAALGVSVAGLWSFAQSMQPPTVAPRAVSVELVIQGAAWRITYLSNGTLNNTAFSILEEASSRLGFSVEYVRYTLPPGVFVTSINGSVNGDGGRFWQYWVNGVYGNAAADHYEVHSGDSVLWDFSIPQEGIAS